METANKLEEAYIAVLSNKESDGSLETRKWESSMIHSTTYNFENETLLIEFNDSREYTYDSITQNEYEEFTKAESQGKYFLANFRNKKVTHKVNEHQENGRS